MEVTQVPLGLNPANPAGGGKPGQRVQSSIACELVGILGFDQPAERCLVAIIDASQDGREILGNTISDQVDIRSPLVAMAQSGAKARVSCTWAIR